MLMLLPDYLKQKIGHIFGKVVRTYYIFNMAKTNVVKDPLILELIVVVC